jgi:hypothetical protein
VFLCLLPLTHLRVTYKIYKREKLQVNQKISIQSANCVAEFITYEDSIIISLHAPHHIDNKAMLPGPILEQV